ncbi:MAG: glycosyltransferase involved in cell wall biosynthesis [Ulvibacter sp.]|jgi:glycosyltransferase involved in cell wall biosynthesis
MLNKLSIIIPAYNEASIIHLILDKIKEVQLVNGIKKEIIIIDDFSNDNSQKVIKNYIDSNHTLNIQFIQHDENKGKGAALRTGINKANR